ncbi:hypothetical protein [Rheinheimera sp. UJ63]|uniref:hypothetical protein n=1 Tax=Rheinheimera sp. UJ63 TaxID=2910157 RepID=UPI001F1FCEC6|nr:hypothetical protein [Rheinheimera sp. UJ63]MCF4009496.1 hypothetical protein [Rheinheimera sp. UJ63]
MRNVVFCFGFLTLISVIIGTLAAIGLVAGVLTNVYPDISLSVTSIIFFLLAAINAVIAYSLVNRKKWAYKLGALEMLMVISLAVVNLAFHGFSALTGALVWILISVVIMVELKKDFKLNDQLSNGDMPHV